MEKIDADSVGIIASYLSSAGIRDLVRDPSIASTLVKIPGIVEMLNELSKQ